MSEFKETAIISLDILYEREMFADIVVFMKYVDKQSHKS